jgi:citrate synthase
MPQSGGDIRSDIGWSNKDRIVIRGHNLIDELMGNINFGDFGFLELVHRLPNEQESAVFNGLLVSLVEHGLTANALATRLTYLGAPESLQGAVAAGLLGLGSTFVGTIESSARMLQEADTDAVHNEGKYECVAQDIVESFVTEKKPVPGIGHPIHKPVDPRAEKLFTLARENGFSSVNERLMRAVAASAEERLGKQLPVNVTGAIGAIASTLGVRWQVCRGLGVMARAVGLVGHVLEELDQPMAATVWHRAEREASAHLAET